MLTTRRVHWNEDGNIRKFRCYDINHYVGAESADDIIINELGFHAEDYDDELLTAVENAKIKQLQRTIPEVIIEVVGEINNDDIEDLLCNEITEATGWWHEGFKYEEIK